MTNLNGLSALSSIFKQPEQTMPVLFAGHGSPINGIENNIFSEHWKKLGKELPRPIAVLCISAHWLTRGTYVTTIPTPDHISR